MRLALVFLAACWTGSVRVEPVARPVKAVRHKPQCWSAEFHESWPEEIYLYDLIEQCQRDEPDQEVSDGCVYAEMWRGYQRLLYWTQRWFEACDPGISGSR